MSGLKRNILVILILFIISTAALANAGTSLMWATAAHLLIGNLFIGILEGLLLAKIYGISAKKCVNIFILANYFSAWVGFKIISQICPTLPLDIDNILPMFWVMVVASYILTIILEFPFAVFAFKGDNEWLKNLSVEHSLSRQFLMLSFLGGLEYQVGHRYLPRRRWLTHLL
jgi:hypothetical protein